MIKSAIYGGIVALAAIGVTARSCSCIPAGHIGVIDTFGNVSENKLKPGVNFPVNPLAMRIGMDARTKQLEEKMSVPTSDGLTVELDVSVLYHLNPEKANEVYKTVGPDYEKVIVTPNLRNITRDVIGGHIPDDLYTAKRKVITQEIEEKLGAAYCERGIELERILLRGVVLPASVTGSIEDKVKKKQESEQMKYVVQKENKEAKRKLIEAGGLADAQTIISESLTPEYLIWRNLTSLEGLAGSPNTVFYILPQTDSKNIVPMLPLEHKTGGKK